MSDETPEERQDNEFEALKSIYGDDVVDNRENIAWKLWRPLDLLLTLHPLHNSNVQGIHCSVTLNIKCCAKYPEKPPSISINKMHGLSTENAAKLLTDLENLAVQQCGEVMIFQLAQHAQQFLHDHNRPTLSFYDEMLKQRIELENLKLHDKLVKENEERQKIKDEIQRRQEILRVASKQRIHRSSASQDDSTDGQGDAPKLLYYADDKISPVKKTARSRNVNVPCTCGARGAQVLRITQRNNKKVYIGKCLGHSSNGSTTYLAIDDDFGERLITKKWSLSTTSDFQTRNKQLTSVQNDLKVMCRIKHSNLVPYLAMETPKESKRTSKHSYYIFRDFILGISLKHLKQHFSAFSDKFEALKVLRRVGLGVFSALSELHSVSLVHRDVRSENVFLDDCGEVKLVGAALDSRFTEMYEDANYGQRQTQAQDIYATAQLLLSIISQNGSIYEVPSDLPGSAKDFFSRCLTEDEHTQWSAEQLVNHSFLVDTPIKQVNGKHKNDKDSHSEDEESERKMNHISLPTNGHSRINAEFEVLTWLGSGAFGDVLKVKNKLDGGFYAIKRVQLNPSNVQLNKKITREVKLLSQLNHENVVRYYNAWIESMTCENNEEEETTTVVKSNPIKKITKNSLEGIVAKLGQDVKIEWSISEGPMQNKDASSDSEEVDDDDEPDPWFNRMSPNNESSSGIEFEVDSDNKSETLPSELTETLPSEITEDEPRPPSERLKQVLYIQMEFCDKHTLRQAIDNGLYQEHFRAWRLFREIVEGLAHVHQKGVIHRDLKPVNIFLDSNDHVKIGDFGLATNAFTGLPIEEKVKLPEEFGGSLTGQVGTALYVAPELLQAGTKVIYNQKVDIYSLGIILFEMFHKTLDTGMERMLVLTDLRSKDIVVPKDFECEDNTKQIHVIRWLLNHDASLRPTCAELLASEHVPRTVHEGALSGLLSHTLSERGSRGYTRLVAACLDQKLSAAEDLTYHQGIKNKQLDDLATIKDIVIKVFRSHGATEFSPPLLTPRTKYWDQYPNAVKVMTSSGYVCHLPHDLRLPFARHTAYSGIKYMRRYIVDKVFREKHVPGFHPREMVECAFDIVTPKTDSLWPDAELLLVASKAASDCYLKVALQLNHTELLKTLLISCGVPLDKHVDIYSVLVDVSLGRITSLQLQTHLTSLCVSNRDVTNLLQLMEADVGVHELRELVIQMVKQVKLSKIVNQAVHELEAVYRNAKALGCECPITVVPFLAYNAPQHAGVFWRMSAVTDDKLVGRNHPRAKTGDLIAAGGRYDALVEEFWQVARTENDHNSELKCSSVGFSMSLERMAAILKKLETEMPPILKCAESSLICVCMWGTVGTGRDGIAAAKRAQLAKDLWSAGYRCCPWTGCCLDAHELIGAGIVLQQDDTAVRIACCTGDRVREHKVPYIDVLDFIKQNISPDAVKTPEGSNYRTMSWSEAEKSNGPTISVTYITGSDKINKNSKRHCENQINTQVTSSLTSLGLQPILGRVRVSVLALACEAACVRALSAHITAPLDAADLVNAFRLVQPAFSKRQDILDKALKGLTNLATSQCNQNRSTEETQLYALYSISDSVCRIIT